MPSWYFTPNLTTVSFLNLSKRNDFLFFWFVLIICLFYSFQSHGICSLFIFLCDNDLAELIFFLNGQLLFRQWILTVSDFNRSSSLTLRISAFSDLMLSISLFASFSAIWRSNSRMASSCLYILLFDHFLLPSESDWIWYSEQQSIPWFFDTFWIERMFSVI